MSVIFPPGWSQPHPLPTGPVPFADPPIFDQITYDPQLAALYTTSNGHMAIEASFNTVLGTTETPYFDAQPHLPILFQSGSHSTEKFGEVFNQTQSPQNTIECEQDVQKLQKRRQNCTSSSLRAKHRRRITLSKDELGLEEKYLLRLAKDKRPWKDKTASYNIEFSKKATQEALQMRLKRIKDETKVWTDDEVRVFLSINPNPMSPRLHSF